MCDGLYIASQDIPAEIQTIVIGASAKAPEEKYHLGDLKVKEMLPTVAPNQNLCGRAFFMEWGYPDGKAQNDRRFSEVRVEKAAEDVLFIDGYRKHRCLIPVTCYYETVKKAGKTERYAVYPAQGEYMYLGGIYCKLDKKPYAVLLTQPAGGELEEVCDTMPIIVPREYAAKWISTERSLKSVMRLMNGRSNGGSRVICKRIEE